MAFDIGSLLGGTFAGGGGEGLLGGQPGLLDLVPGFRFQNDKFDISFDPRRMKRDRAIRRLIEQQTGERVPDTLTPTAGGSNLVSAPNPFPQFPGLGGGLGTQLLQPNHLFAPSLGGGLR